MVYQESLPSSNTKHDHHSISERILKSNVKQIFNQTINILFTDKRKVYSWGRADYGQLGREVQHQYDPIPQPISGLDDVICIQCGSEHNLALSGKYF